MHKKHQNAFIIISCIAIMGGYASASIIGCSLDPVTYAGKTCPPSKEGGSLDYISLGDGQKCTESAICYDSSFDNNACPIDISECNIDKKSKFYCSKTCDAGTITCEGRCINPETSNDFCGAENTCKGKGYNCCANYTVCNKWQECHKDPNSNLKPTCRDKPCTNGDERCLNNIAERCVGGVWMVHEECALGTTCNAEQTACEAPVNCTYKGMTVLNGQSLCDNDVNPAVALTCKNAIMQSIECPSDEITGMTGKCELDNGNAKCVIPMPNDCILNTTVVPHNASICDDNNVRTCYNGTLDVSSCPPMDSPELTVCYEGKCTFPVDCANGIKHEAYTCSNDKIMQCFNGNLIESSDCATNTDGKTTCKAGECAIPEYTSIKALHTDYKKLINQATCADSSDRLYYDNSRPANVTIEGVVTAVRDDELGFVVQEPSEDGKQAGIHVYCQGKDCMKYTGSGATIQVGDNVKITSDGIGQFYCQMQLRSFENKLIIEKTDKTETIAPVIVLASDINTEEPNNPYYGSLVTIERFTTGTDKQTRPTGWPGNDENGKPIIVNNGFKPETLDAMEPQKTYQVTGVANWTFNHNVLVPRTNDDIVFLPNCEPEETSVKCLKTAGNVYLTTCENGLEEQTNCSDSGKVCDKDLRTCREKAVCTDKDNANINESSTGCFSESNNEYIGKCIYSNGSVWDVANATLCPNGCNATKTACKHAALKNCQYIELNQDTLQSTVRVNVPKGAEITTTIYCTTDISAPILEWPFQTSTEINHNCTDCSQNNDYTVTEYVTNNAQMPDNDGKHYCVAVASVKDGDQYLCKSSGSNPDPITGSTQTTASYTQTYTVSRPLLAEWNFDDSNTTVDGGAVTSATFALVNAGGKAPNYNTGTYGQAIAAQANWSTNGAPEYINDPHWEIQIDTTGYKNIAISFSVRASGNSSKSIALAYKTDNSFQHVGTDLTFSDKDKFHDYPVTSLPSASNASNVIIGIYPYATTSNPNVRIDDVKIFGDKI